MSTTNSQEIQELIHRRRRQVLLHSIIYYRFNTTVIDDGAFDSWARELAQLQQQYPQISEEVKYHLEAFRDFAGETGYHLPLHDIRMMRVAKHMIHGVQ